MEQENFKRVLKDGWYELLDTQQKTNKQSLLSWIVDLDGCDCYTENSPFQVLDVLVL